MEMDFFVLLKPGTESGKVKKPSVPPESFSVVVPNQTGDLIMQAVERIAHCEGKPMMQIQLRYRWQDLAIIKSRMEPLTLTDSPYAFPIKPKDIR